MSHYLLDPSPEERIAKLEAPVSELILHTRPVTAHDTIHLEGHTDVVKLWVTQRDGESVFTMLDVRQVIDVRTFLTQWLSAFDPIGGDDD